MIGFQKSNSDTTMELLNSGRIQEVSLEKNRLTILKFLIIVLPMWISAKFYSGPNLEFVRNYLAAIILMVLLALIFQFIYTRSREKAVLVSLFIVLSLIQAVYIAMPSLLSELTFSIGQGTFFGGEPTFHMIPYYGVGGFIGYFVLKGCRKKGILRK